MALPGLPRLNLGALTGSWKEDGGTAAGTLSGKRSMLSPVSSQGGESMLEQHRHKERFFDRWVASCDQAKVEIQIEALELRNGRLEQELERERDRRLQDAVERDDRQIALGTAIAARLYDLRDGAPGIAASWFSPSTRQAEQNRAEQWASRQKDLARRVVAKITKAALGGAFQGWLDGAQWQRRGRGACLRILQRMQHLATGRALGQWCEQVESRRSAEAQAAKQAGVVKRVGRKMMRRAITIAFDGWCERVAKTIHIRDVCRKVVWRMTHGQLARAFDCYAEHIESLRAQRERVARTLSTWKNPELKRCMQSWLEYMDIAHEEQMEEEREIMQTQLGQQVRSEEERSRELLQQESERRVAMCKRVVQRMLLHQLSMAWHEFVDSVYTVKANRDTVGKVLARMTRRKLAGAFECYAENVDNVRVQRKRVQQTIARWRTPGARMALDLWLAYVDLTHSEREQEAQQMAREELLKQKGEMEASLIHESNQRATEALEAQAQKRIQMARRVVAKMMKQALSHAFEAWHTGADLQRLVRDRCSKIVLRMQRAGLSRAFDGFVERVGESKELKIKLSRAMSRWRRPALEVGFNGWLEGMQTQGLEKAEAQRELAEAENRMQTVGRVISKMMKKSVSVAFDGWCFSSNKQKEGRRKCKRVLQRMQRAGLSRAFDGFVERVGESKELMAKLAGAVSRWRRPALEVGFNGWLEYIANEADSRTSEANASNLRRMQELEQAMNDRKMLFRESNQRATEALEAQAQKRIQMARRVVAKMMKQALSHAFEAWHTGADLQRLVRDRCSKIVLRMQRAGLSRAFDGFVERVGESKELKIKLSRAMSRWRRPALEVGFNGWLEYIANEAAGRLKNSHEADKQLHAEEILRLKNDMEQTLEVKERESERRENALKTELEQAWREEAKGLAQREADVMSQLQALEVDLAKEARKAAKKMHEIEESAMQLPSLTDPIHMFDLEQLNQFKNGSTSVGHDGDGTAHTIYGDKSAHAVSGRARSAHQQSNLAAKAGFDTGAENQLLEAQTRLAELRQQRASLGAKIQAKLADVNLSLEEYYVPSMHSADLDSRTLIRDSNLATQHKLELLRKEFDRAEKARKSKTSSGYLALKDLKEVRKQQGYHSHYEGSPVLPTDLPKKGPSTTARGPAHSRKQEIAELIDDLSKPSRGALGARFEGARRDASARHEFANLVQKIQDDEEGICGRPGWFRS